MAASVELLKAARAKIADPANFTAEAYARTSAGRAIGPREENASCFCLIGALLSAGAKLFGYEAYLLNGIAVELGFDGAFDANDVGGHAVALSVLDRAIARAEASNA